MVGVCVRQGLRDICAVLPNCIGESSALVRYSRASSIEPQEGRDDQSGTAGIRLDAGGAVRQKGNALQAVAEI